MKKTQYFLPTILTTTLLIIFLVLAQNNRFTADATVDGGMVGDGTATSPFEVRTTDDLFSIWDDLDAHYILMNDIFFEASDFAEGGKFYDYGYHPDTGVASVYGYGWDSLGHAATPFSGVFDGQNYTVSGLYQNIDTTFRYQIGLFGYVENGVVKNLKLAEVDITATSNIDVFTGAVVGHLVNSTVENCTVSSGTVAGDNYTGGVVGWVSDNSRVVNCTNYAAVTGKDSDYIGLPSEPQYNDYVFVGGIAGRVGYSVTNEHSGGTVENSTNHGTVVATCRGASPSYSSAGGIVGSGEGGRVFDCVNNGEVTARLRDDAGAAQSVSTYSGGIVGYTFITTIERCVNNANVFSTATSAGSNAGGIVGGDTTKQSESSSTSETNVNFSTNNGTVTATSNSSISAGGIASYMFGNIFNSKNSGAVVATVESETDYAFVEVGGLVGVATGKIGSSYNEGDVTVTTNIPTNESRTIRLGGIAGRTFSVGNEVANCYNSGDLVVTELANADNSEVYVGGLVGFIETSSITNGYNVGTISSAGTIAGGVGYMATSSVFENIYSIGNFSRILSVKYGLPLNELTNYNWGLTAEEAVSEASYIGFDFENVWTMEGETGYNYPELKIFAIDPSATVKSIEILTLPEKLDYILEDDFTVDGGVLTVTYLDGSATTVNMSAGMASGYDKSALGKQTVTVIFGGISTTYEVTVKTTGTYIGDELANAVAKLPQTSGAYTDEQIEAVKALIEEEIRILKNPESSDKIRNPLIDDVRENYEIVENLVLLEAALMKTDDMLSVEYAVPTVEDGVSAETALPQAAVEFSGLVLAVKGKGFPTFFEEKYSVEVTQKVPTDSIYDILLEIKPKESTQVIANHNIYTPVTFKIYLNDSFDFQYASIRHTTQDTSAPQIDENFTVPVLSDHGGKYIEMTVERFSEFNIKGVNDLPFEPSVKLDIQSHNPNIPLTVQLFATADTERENPIYTIQAQSLYTYGDTLAQTTTVLFPDTLAKPFNAGVYDIVISKEGHFDEVIEDVDLLSAELVDLSATSIKMVAGDVNGDGKINFADLAIVRNSNNYGKSWNEVVDSAANLNGDSTVNTTDLAIIIENYNTKG